MTYLQRNKQLVDLTDGKTDQEFWNMVTCYKAQLTHNLSTQWKNKTKNELTNELHQCYLRQWEICLIHFYFAQV